MGLRTIETKLGQLMEKHKPMFTRRFALLCGFVFFASASFAFGNDDTWVSGFGQGIKEALIRKGPGNSIYVACEAGSGISSSISFTLAGKSPSGSSIVLTFDQQDPERTWVVDGRIQSDCRACAANFDHVLDNLKRHSSVHVLFENGDGARFSLAGSTKAIGDCKAGFYQ